MITVRLEPEQEVLEMPNANTVQQLLNRLERLPGTVLVIRDGTLLTPDVKLQPQDTITIRSVISMG